MDISQINEAIDDGNYEEALFNVDRLIISSKKPEYLNFFIRSKIYKKMKRKKDEFNDLNKSIDLFQTESKNIKNRMKRVKESHMLHVARSFHFTKDDPEKFISEHNYEFNKLKRRDLEKDEDDFNFNFLIRDFVNSAMFVLYGYKDPIFLSYTPRNKRLSIAQRLFQEVIRMESLLDRKEEDFKKEISFSYGSLGAIDYYNRLILTGNWFSNLRKAIRLLPEDSFYRITFKMFIGACYLHKTDYTDAAIYFEHCFNYFRDHDCKDLLGEKYDFYYNSVTSYLYKIHNINRNDDRAFYFKYLSRERYSISKENLIKRDDIRNLYDAISFFFRAKYGVNVERTITGNRLNVWNIPISTYQNLFFAFISMNVMNDMKNSKKAIFCGFADGVVTSLFEILLGQWLELYQKEINGSLERADFLASKPEHLENHSVRVKWINEDSSVIYVPHIFMTKHVASDTSMIILPSNYPRIDPKYFYNFLYGNEIPKEELVKSLPSLWMIFSKLKMLDYILVVCEILQYFPISDLGKAFNRCSFILEREENSNIENIEILDSLVDGEVNEVEKKEFSFRSVFSLYIFNILKSKIEEVEKNNGLLIALERMGFLSKLRTWKNTNIMSHEILRDWNPPRIKFTTKNVFKMILSKISRDPETSNLVLQSEVDNGEIFKVHKDVLIMNSIFFHRCFAFPGRESNTNHVMIKYLSTEALRYYLANLYDGFTVGGEEERMGISSIFQLLVHLEMYEEHFLIGNIFTMLIEKLSWHLRTGSFVLKILENGKYLNNLTESVLEALIGRWERLFKVENIRSIVEHAKKTSVFAEENNNLKLQLKDLKNEKRKRNRNEDESDDEVDEFLSDNQGRRRKRIKIE